MRVKLLATTMRVLYDDMTAGHLPRQRRAARRASSATTQPGAQDVLGGATSGFTKAFARERTDALVKVVDVATDAAAEPMSPSCCSPRPPAIRGAVEVGYADGLRWGIGLADATRWSPTRPARSGPTTSSSSPAPPAASSARSPPTSPPRRVARSTCST